jgi:hypothetical protein
VKNPTEALSDVSLALNMTGKLIRFIFSRKERKGNQQICLMFRWRSRILVRCFTNAQHDLPTVFLSESVGKQTNEESDKV